MYKNTNIEMLGTDYTVTDQKGNLLRKIQIIPHTDILEAALGLYTEEFSDVQAYLDKSISVLSGFDQVDMNRVLWFSTEDEEVVLAEIIEYAVKHDYDKIILEYIDPLLED